MGDFSTFASLQTTKGVQIKDSVAQLVEQYTFNVWVLGSNPSGITKKPQRKVGAFLCTLESNPGVRFEEGSGLRCGNGGTEPIPAGSLLGTSLKKKDLSHFFCPVTYCYFDK